RVMASVEHLLTSRLKLKVNRAKSAVAPPVVRKFLGADRVAQGRAYLDRGIADRSRGSREAVAATETRRLAAILAADVAGYSRLMGADEEGTLQRLKAHRRVLIDPKISEHHGRIVKTTGDGMLVEFSSVVDAVRCAVEI